MTLWTLVPVDLIQFMVLPYLIPTNSHNHCHPELILRKQFHTLLVLNKQFYLLAVPHLPRCRLSPLKFGRRWWCPTHHPVQCLLVRKIKQTVRNHRIQRAQRPRLPGIQMLRVRADENEEIPTSPGSPSFSYHLGGSDNNPAGLTRNTLLPIFAQVLEGSDLKISHTCCQGSGLMYGPVT